MKTSIQTFIIDRMNANYGVPKYSFCPNVIEKKNDIMLYPDI